MLLAPLLAACSSGGIVQTLTPYRIEVVQGNVVTSEQIALLRPGMSRGQTRDIMGSPLLVDPFHADRWDYVFTIRRQGTAAQERVIMLKFENDVLKTIDAPSLPSERDFVASIDTFRKRKDPGPLMLTDEQRRALPVPARPAASAAEPLGANRDYPPLEPNS